MKNRIYIYILAIIELSMQIMVFMSLQTVLAFGFFVTEETDLLTSVIVTVVPVTILYLARNFLHNNILLILVHIFSAFFILKQGNTAEEKLPYVIVGMIIIVYSMLICNNGHKKFDEKIPMGMIGVFIAAIIIGNAIGVEIIESFALYAGIIFLIMHIVYKDISNINDFMELNRDTASLPVKQIMSVNGFILTAIVTVCCGIIFICNSSYVKKMVDSVMKIIRNIILIILRKLFSYEMPKKQEVIVTDKEAPETGLQMLLDGMGENPYQDIMNGIAIILFTLVTIAIVIALSVAVVKFVRNFKGSSGFESDIKEFITPEGIKTFRIRREKQEKEDKSASDNLKVRKLYKNMVKKNAAKAGEKVSDSMMPKDISEKYVHGKKDEVTIIYEKARYSNQKITGEELALMQAVVKNKF